MFRTWPDLVGLYLGLAALIILLTSLRAQSRDIFQVLQDQPVYRLCVAAVGGWLGAWFLMPVSWGTPPSHGLYLPGTIFGISVLIPLVEKPWSHPIRVAITVCAATIAHFMLWLVGLFLYSWVWGTLQVYDYPSRLPVALIVVGGTSIVAFGVFMMATASRVVGLRFNRFQLILMLCLCVVIGFLYALIVPGIAGDLFGWPKRLENLLIDDFSTYLLYVLWFVALAGLFGLGEVREVTGFSKGDIFWLGGLAVLAALLIILSYWSGILRPLSLYTLSIHDHLRVV